MGNEFVSRVALEVNGQLIEDFDTVSEMEIEVRRPVRLARKRGFVKVNPNYGVKVDYVVPSGVPEFDFQGIEDATLTIDKEDGSRIVYTGVFCMKVGETRYGEEGTPAKRTIELGAVGRIEE